MASYSTTAQTDLGLQTAAFSHPQWFQQTYRKAMFSLTLQATTSGVAAGNIMGASAAAATQFALVNPATSSKNLILTKFFMGIISGTPAAGPLFHGFCTTVPTIASIGGTIRNNFLGNATASVAIPHSLAAGSALTGCSAPIVFRASDFSTTATAQATPGAVNSLCLLEGDIIIPPGIMWLPLWSAAGTSLLNSYSISWYEA